MKFKVYVVISDKNPYREHLPVYAFMDKLSAEEQAKFIYVNDEHDEDLCTYVKEYEIEDSELGYDENY